MMLINIKKNVKYDQIIFYYWFKIYFETRL